MKKVLFTISAFGIIAGSLSAQTVLIPNGDFESGSTNWTEASGGGSGATFTYPATGGNTGGYGSIEATSGAWAVLVSPVDPGAAGGGVPVGDLGVTAGSAYDFVWDMTILAGATNGGMKVEAWGANALLGNTGDIRPTTIGDGSTWESYSTNYMLPLGTDKLIFVPLWGDTSTVGFDNVGVVVPEPSTIAALFGFFALGFVIYRRRR
jgi:hypothetical protein